MKIAIDLLWVKPQKSGGIEAYIRNLLDGFLDLECAIDYVLIVAKDNKNTFLKYTNDPRFSIIECNINATNVGKRIIWQNIMLDRILNKNNIKFCFEPIYSKPLRVNNKVKYVTTIHDLQALHYPEYFSYVKYLWMKYSWRNAIHTSKKIIAISNFVKEDILERFNVSEQKLQVIYNPIIINNYEMSDFKIVSDMYGVEENNYFYTVAQLLPHKNIETIVKVIKYIKENNVDLPNKLLISGINGKSKESLLQIINDNNLEQNIVLTGYIDDKIRNTLYKNCKGFLFPSVFEGFGMPPVEAMMLQAKVICTKKTSIYEVTQGQAIYVENPYNIQEWIQKMHKLSDCAKQNLDFEKYNKRHIAQQYIDVFYEVMEY